MTALIIVLVLIVIIAVIYYLFISSMSQVFGRFPYRGKTRNKVLALTFDDGPNGAETERLLDILDKYDVKATFFESGQFVKKFPEITKRQITEGHIVGSHLMSHNFATNFNIKKFEAELLAGRQAIKDATGKTPLLFRSPWLFRTPRILGLLKKHNFQPVSGLFINWIEALRPPTWLIYQTGLLQARPGVIIIAHDGNENKGGSRKQTIDAIDRLIPELKKRGYQFVTVDKLLDISPYSETV
jgi:peptidoglycan/xylan/chitin deacetylase (PgdA/CDA1 family)